MIEPTGYTALDLVGFTDRGTYAANVNYVKNDLVHYGGNIWRILIDDTIGITPAEGPNYTLFIGEPTNLVERIIAPLEDNPATVAYTTGRQIIYNDHLYEVIQNIAIGDVLIAYEDDPTNANIKLASPVETQVLALNASKVNKSDVVNNVTTTTAGKVLDARQGKVLQDGKTDTSVIAPVESGTTASQAYAEGAHFIKNGAFCTAKTAIAQGETFTLNTNYTAGNIGGKIDEIEGAYLKKPARRSFAVAGTEWLSLDFSSCDLIMLFVFNSNYCAAATISTYFLSSGRYIDLGGDGSFRIQCGDNKIRLNQFKFNDTNYTNNSQLHVQKL